MSYVYGLWNATHVTYAFGFFSTAYIKTSLWARPTAFKHLAMSGPRPAPATQQILNGISEWYEKIRALVHSFCCRPIYESSKNRLYIYSMRNTRAPQRLGMLTSSYLSYLTGSCSKVWYVIFCKLSIKGCHSRQLWTRVDASEQTCNGACK